MTVKEKSTLRFITCGSVDDGKSTLIGRLLYESKLVFQDQLQKLDEDNKKFGTQKNKIDFALLVDGLAAEREQGITIDVAYRFFSTKNRKFIVADTPGHEQYTRNMATGASTADLAIILVDARKGILSQTKRHTLIISLLGIKNVILAVNKLDLINYDEKTFTSIRDNFEDFSNSLSFENIDFVPISGLLGDNIISKSKNMPWYKGYSLMEKLDRVLISSLPLKSPLRLTVQYVIRPNQDFRGYAGTIHSGSLKKGQRVVILPSGIKTKVDKIYDYQKIIDLAPTNKAVTFTLTDNVDLSRGDMIADADKPAQSANQFNINIIWMDDNKFVSGKNYLIKVQAKTLNARIIIKNRIDINNFSKIKSNNFSINEIGVCEIIFEKSILYEKYSCNKILGSMIIIDPFTNATSGVGMINFALRRSQNLSWQKLEVSKNDRSKIKSQKPCVLWFTGISGSGKSSIANILEKKLYQHSFHTILLDGDNIRHGLNEDLGFTEKDRIENIRRISEVSKLMIEAGLIVLVCFISPFKVDRERARQKFEKNEFLEIFVDTSITEAEKRDTKGLYKKARLGEIKNFTGIDSPYEMPTNPELHLKTNQFSAKECAKYIFNFLVSKEIIKI